MLNFKLTLEFEGTNYSGWQTQKNQITIQKTLETNISKILNQKITVIGAGRTDAGVHATGFVANFKCITNLDNTKILLGLNSTLPKDIIVKSCKQVDLDFHAQKNSKGKVYEYLIYNSNIPCAIERNFIWWYKWPLDLDSLTKTLNNFIGTHDFKSFMGAGSSVKSTVRTINNIEVSKNEDKISILFSGYGFLKQMIRNIVGTSIGIVSKKKDPNIILEIIKSCDRKKAGLTAPAKGLFLRKVFY